MEAFRSSKGPGWHRNNKRFLTKKWTILKDYCAKNTSFRHFEG